MSLLEQGIRQRLDDVSSHFESDSQWLDDNERYSKVLEKIKDKALLDELETAVNTLISTTSEASYRMGVHDGFMIREDIAKSLGGGR